MKEVHDIGMNLICRGTGSQRIPNDLSAPARGSWRQPVPMMPLPKPNTDNISAKTPKQKSVSPQTCIDVQPPSFIAPRNRHCQFLCVSYCVPHTILGGIACPAPAQRNVSPNGAAPQLIAECGYGTCASNSGAVFITGKVRQGTCEGLQTRYA